MDKPQVFISYGREDALSAERLYQDLLRAGLNPWLDTIKLLPGQKWEDAITRAIRESRYFVALISSKSYVRRGYVQKEIKRALEVLEEFPSADVFVIPARLDNTEIDDPKLMSLHWVDLFPNWGNGVAKILLSMQIETGSKFVGGGPAESFTVSGSWSSEGLEIKGGRTVIPPVEAMKLFRALLDWLPKFVEKERQREDGDDVTERALLLATLRACHDVYGNVPDEKEMQRASSILSRKLNLFGVFAKHIFGKAQQGGIDLGEFLFNERNGSAHASNSSTEDEENINPDRFPQICLHCYILRACDIDPQKVEFFESTMRNAGLDWESMVEDVYQINEEKIVSMFQNIRSAKLDIKDDEIVAQLTSFIIDEQYGIDLEKFRKNYMKA